MSKEPSPAQKMIGDFAPKLVDLIDRVLFGEVWECPELSKRDRSLATVSALIAMNRPDQLRFYLSYAVHNGAKKEELIEVITASGVLFRLAQCNERHHGRKRGIFEGLKAGSYQAKR
jgi:alkylhydroperoxidase/carboxymuconolactone decarboxylase family protein YurZ